MNSKYISTMTNSNDSIPIIPTIVLYPTERKLFLGLSTSSSPKIYSQALATHDSILKQDLFEMSEFLKCANTDEDDVFEKTVENVHEIVENIKNLYPEKEEFIKTKNQTIYSNDDDKCRELSKMQSQFNYSMLSPSEDNVFGRVAELLNPDNNFTLIYPFAELCSDIRNIGHSKYRSTVINLWKTAIESELKIKSKDFHRYRCVLAIPDIIGINNASYLVDMLMELEFQAILGNYASILTSIGMGFSTALIANINCRHIHFTCVDDLLIVPHTVYTVPFGSQHLYQLFLKLLHHQPEKFESNLPTELSVEEPQVFEMTQSIFLKNCHLLPTQCQNQAFYFDVVAPIKGIDLPYDYSRFCLNINSISCIAPLAFFYPELFGYEKINATELNALTWPQISADSQAKRKNNARRRNKEEYVVDESNYAHLGESILLPVDKPFPIDLIIYEELRKIENPTIRQRLSEAIVVTGEYTMLEGFHQCLEERVLQRLASMNSDIAKVHVHTPDVKETEYIAWKGGCIFCQLPTAMESFVPKETYQKEGFISIAKAWPVPFEA
eukprot:TRINITY_DN1433_c0_g1_i1.p1 TRINITY_DN1433_c0_g1~~TRINITY_DN1433_c0_g1_i1.p1  ORF type:complete len:568 (+),score=162.13 TRINITY_DN1433_c0_g1_i1:45-1706(+)